jgi:hypothetical protein
VSDKNDNTPEDRPEYARGDLVEVFHPRTNCYRWVTVERVSDIRGTQILKARGAYFCACWVRLESLATPGLKGGD